MASDTRVVPQLNDVTIDADWRIAAQAIEAALLAVGLTKMSGPTQMDLATVAAPATNAQATGYHYWQFTDPKQASRPICFRTSYGRWTAATRFSLKILVAGGFTAAGATVGWSMTEEQIGPITGAQAGGPTVTCARALLLMVCGWLCTIQPALRPVVMVCGLCVPGVVVISAIWLISSAGMEIPVFRLR